MGISASKRVATMAFAAALVAGACSGGSGATTFLPGTSPALMGCAGCGYGVLAIGVTFLIASSPLIDTLTISLPPIFMFMRSRERIWPLS